LDLKPYNLNLSITSKLISKIANLKKLSIFNLVNDMVIAIYDTLLNIYPLDATFFLNVIHSQEYIIIIFQLDLVKGFQFYFLLHICLYHFKQNLYFLNICFLNLITF